MDGTRCNRLHQIVSWNLAFMKRDWFWPISAVIASLLALAIVWLGSGHEPRVNKSQFDKIQTDMTRAEVYRLLGGPPGSYGTRVIAVPTKRVAEGAGKWVGDEGYVTVTFDAKGHVTDKEFLAVSVSPKPSLWTRLRRWLGI